MLPWRAGIVGGTSLSSVKKEAGEVKNGVMGHRDTHHYGGEVMIVTCKKDIHLRAAHEKKTWDERLVPPIKKCHLR